jgi:uncharacterized protein (UPF0261 family)
MAIAVCGMLDEREDGLLLIKEKIEKRGHQAIVIDFSIGTGGIRPSFKADITCEELATAGGADIATVKANLRTEREKATSAMARGLASKTSELHAAGKLQGIIAVGGMTGTMISLPALKQLPFGLPKVLISSTAALPHYANYFAQFFAVSDMTVMHTVVDTVGMNPMLRNLLVNGAGAVAGMVENHEVPAGKTKPSIAITEYGFSEQCAHYVREQLEHDFNVVSFHAQGIGDLAVEHMVGQGLFDGFIDLVPSAIGEYILGGNRPSGPDRLEAAGKAGIPYVLAPCGFDCLSCGPIERKDRNDPLWTSRRLAERKMFIQDKQRVQVRTSPEEMKIFAKAVGEKLNAYPDKKLVKFLIPTRGFTTLGAEGGVLYEPETDRVFADELRKQLDPAIQIAELDTHLNSLEFATAVVEAFKEAYAARSSSAVGSERV